MSLRILAAFFLLFVTFLHISSLHAVPAEEFPVLYKGRFRPAEAYARLWLYEMAHRQSIKKEDLEHFQSTDSSALGLLWSLEFYGNARYQNAPLFWIGSADLKRLAALPLKSDRFSALELQKASAVPGLTKEIEEQDKKLGGIWAALLSSLNEFEHIQTGPSALEQNYLARLKQLQNQKAEPKEIGDILEQEYPTIQRLHTVGDLFKSLPSRFKPGDWLPLRALTLQVYNSSSNSLEPVGNFTLYSDEQFEKIRHAYTKHVKVNIDDLAAALTDGYTAIAGKIMQQAHGKNLFYPTLEQLKVETLYVRFPLIFFLLFLYGTAIFLLIASLKTPSYLLKIASIGAVTFALLCHTAVLAMRCYILQRPPVSNMFETVIYVPWVAGCAPLAPLIQKAAAGIDCSLHGICCFAPHY